MEMREMKTNERPKKNAERDQLIIADHKAGMSSNDLAKKYDLTNGYAQKIASEYAKTERLKAAEEQQKQCGLYVDRDKELMSIVARMKGNVRIIKYPYHQQKEQQA
jgi:transposase